MSINKTFNTVNNWWLYILVGIFFIGSSIWIFNTPKESSQLLDLLFSTTIIFGGVSTLFFAISNSETLKGWGWIFAGGIFEILIGSVFILSPEYPSAMLPLIIGFWLFYRGTHLIGTAIDLKSLKTTNWIWLMILGTMIVAIGIFAILNPSFGSKNVVNIAFIGLLTLGIAQIIHGMKLRMIVLKKTDSLDKLKNKIESRVESLKTEIYSNNSQLTEVQKLKIEEKFEHIKYVID